ncbi:MAG: hypothetical protein WDM92_05635 [Caulobacteraceae bacterium]
MVSRTGRNTFNVCGYIYAHDGYGVYDGRTGFVVGLKDGRVVGTVQTRDGGEVLDEASQRAVEANGGIEGGACGGPFDVLTGEVSRRVLEHQAAESAQKAALQARLQSQIQNELSCMKTYGTTFDMQLCSVCLDDIRTYCSATAEGTFGRSSSAAYEGAKADLNCVAQHRNEVSASCRMALPRG